MTDTTIEKGRGEIEDLLPWYANGRLGPAERRRVEAALATDPELARRLELVREEMAEAIAAAEALPAPSARAFDRLMAEIEATPVAARPLAAAKAGILDRIGLFLGSLAPRRLAYAGLALAVVVALQAAVLGGLLGERAGAPGYETASEASVAANGPTLLVAFRPQATMETVAAFLTRYRVGIVDGPKANGFFRLRPLATLDAAGARTLADRMKAESGLVTFVQVAP